MEGALLVQHSSTKSQPPRSLRRTALASYQCSGIKILTSCPSPFLSTIALDSCLSTENIRSQPFSTMYHTITQHEMVPAYLPHSFYSILYPFPLILLLSKNFLKINLKKKPYIRSSTAFLNVSIFEILGGIILHALQDFISCSLPTKHQKYFLEIQRTLV